MQAPPFLAAAHGHAHAGVLDRDLADARLLDDADDLPDALGARRLGCGGIVTRLPAPTDRVQQRLRSLAEQRQQEQLLLARRQALRLFPHVVEIDLGSCAVVAGRDEPTGPNGGVDRGRRRPEATATAPANSSTTVW